MDQIKATAKNVWLPLGVVVALLFSTIAITRDYQETRSTAFNGYQTARQNEEDIKVMKEDVATRLTRIETLLEQIKEQKLYGNENTTR